MSTPEIHEHSIYLCGPFEAKARKGRVIPVESISIDKESHCCDVYVKIKGEDGDYGLAADETFLASVSEKLRELGYTGKGLGRADWGAQDDDQIVLEADREFEDFAMSKGWQYGDGNDELLVDRALHQLPYGGTIQFTASNGNVMGLDVRYVVDRYVDSKEEELAAQGIDKLTFVTNTVLPGIKADSKIVVSWARELLNEEELSKMLRVVVHAAEPNYAQEFMNKTVKPVGMAASKWRDK